MRSYVRCRCLHSISCKDLFGFCDRSLFFYVTRSSRGLRECIRHSFWCIGKLLVSVLFCVFRGFWAMPFLGGEGGGLGEVVWGFRVALYGFVFWLVFFNLC